MWFYICQIKLLIIIDNGYKSYYVYFRLTYGSEETKIRNKAS